MPTSYSVLTQTLKPGIDLASLWMKGLSGIRFQNTEVSYILNIRFARIEAAEIKLLRPLAGYTLYDHKTDDSIRHELWITGILDKIDEYRWNWLLHLQRMPQNRNPLYSYHYRPQGRTIGRPKKHWRERKGSSP